MPKPSNTQPVASLAAYLEDEMTNLKQLETTAMGWATGHLIATGAICLVVGIILGAIFF